MACIRQRGENMSYQIPEWYAPGIEPPDSKKQAGWSAGEKPPAEWFDWFFNRSYQTFLAHDAVIQKIGEADDLNTAAKEIVPAINETNQRLSQLASILFGARDRFDIEDEIDFRAPGNNGKMYDLIEGSNIFTVRSSSRTSTTAAETAGTATIHLVQASQLEAGKEYVTYDDSAFGKVSVGAVNTSTNEATISSLPVNLKKKAVIARTTAVIDSVNHKIKIGSWGTSTIKIAEVP